MRLGDARRVDAVRDLGEQAELEAVRRLFRRRFSAERDALAGLVLGEAGGLDARLGDDDRLASRRPASRSVSSQPVPSSFGPATFSTTASSAAVPAMRTISPGRKRGFIRGSVTRDGIRPGHPIGSMAAMTWRQWIRTVEIVPALGSADPAAIDMQVEALLRTGCRIFHLRAREDLDRALATARLVGPALRRYDGVLDVQVDADPESGVFAAVAEAGGSSVTFPLESTGDVGAALAAARAFGLPTGIAYSLETDPVEVAERSAGADLVRCPGRDSFEQLRDVRLLARSLPEGTAIEVGGGITHDNVRELYEAGARVLVVGKAIFEREDLPRAYRRLVQALA